jgi:hypothetical protein
VNVKKMIKFTINLFRIPLDPFKAQEATDEVRQAKLAKLEEPQLERVANRLSKRYEQRGVTTANNQVASAFVFGGEIALVLGLVGFMVASDNKGLQIALLPSFLLASTSLITLVVGVILARKMSMPSHIDDEVIEVIDQVETDALVSETLEVGRRTQKQRSRLHVNDLMGNISMVFMVLTVVALMFGVSLYIILS